MIKNLFSVKVNLIDENHVVTTAQYENDIAQYECSLSDSMHSYRDIFTARTASDVREVGQALFKIIFAGQTLELLRQVLADWSVQKGSIPIGVECVSEPLKRYPWELIYDPQESRFLALSQQTPILRLSKSIRKEKEGVQNKNIRILVILSSPQGSWSTLNLLQEKKWFRYVFDPLVDREPKSIEVIYLENVVFSELQQRLNHETFDIVHFMGHADFDTSSNQGYLVLEDEIGKPSLISASNLQNIVSSSKIRLIVLNACHTFTQNSRKGALSVSEACLLGGVNAVVSMQAPVSDDDSVNFSKTFYTNLIRGEPLYQCITAARQSLRNATLTLNASWGVPIFNCTQDSQDTLLDPKYTPNNMLTTKITLNADDFQQRITEIQREGMQKRLKIHFENWLLLEEERATHGRNQPPKLIRDIEYRQAQIAELQNQLHLDELPLAWQSQWQESLQKQLLERQKQLEMLQELGSESLKPLEKIEIQREIEFFQREIELLHYAISKKSLK